MEEHGSSPSGKTTGGAPLPSRALNLLVRRTTIADYGNAFSHYIRAGLPETTPLATILALICGRWNEQDRLAFRPLSIPEDFIPSDPFPAAPPRVATSPNGGILWLKGPSAVLRLSKMESRLFACLRSQPPRVYHTVQDIRRVTGQPSNKAVIVLIGYVRNRALQVGIQAPSILNVRGEGYALAPGFDEHLRDSSHS